MNEYESASCIPDSKRRRACAGKIYVLICVAVCLSLAIALVVLLTIYSWPAVRQLGWAVLTLTWNPASGQYGLLPMLYGTLVVTALALLLAVPMGLAAAVYISEIVNGRYRFLIKSLLELLAGIPSILYGLIGVAFLSVWIKHSFALSSGRTLFCAGILLAIMILPTLMTLAEDGLHNVPAIYRETAKGLGLYPHEIILRCVLPLAGADILGAVLLALGRALGETMAVMLVIGGIDKIPSPAFDLLNPGQTITSKLGREIAESAFASLHFSVLLFSGLLLLILVVVLTVYARYCSKLWQ